MKLKKIKKEKYRLVVLFFICTLAICGIISISTPIYKLEVFKNNKEGYGYQILYKNKIIIYQPNIPSLNNNTTFKTQEDAYLIGSLVLERVKNGKGLSVTNEDLNNYGIKSPVCR